jgi:glycosyltransferase involved in cell wall biosynthesis
MEVFVLVPDIHEQPTGGNIYNRRIITELLEQGTAEAVPWTPDETLVPSLDRAGASGAAASVIVVDSLLVRHEQAVRALRREYASVPLVLLAHYLHCIDPNEQASEAAERERALLPLFDGAVTTSPFARQALVKEGMSEAHVFAVPPGLDETYRAPTPERSHSPPTKLLTVANLLPGKGLLDFVDVLGTLSEVSWRWTLVGDDTLDPDFADTLRARIHDTGITDRVTLTGPVAPSALRTRYDNSDVFVLPSRFETCSMATREAMARGLPVVGYAVGGMPDNFGGVRAGRLVSTEVPDAFGESLRSLIVDPALRRRMGQSARERSQSFPTWGEVGTRVWSVLQKLRGGEGKGDEKGRQ